MLIGPNWSHLEPIGRVLSHWPHLDIYFDYTLGNHPTLSYSDECRTKMLLYVKRMLPLFRALVKFCSTSRLFNDNVVGRRRFLILKSSPQVLANFLLSSLRRYFQRRCSSNKSPENSTYWALWTYFLPT